MEGYVKLFGSITVSTVWDMPHAHRIVWITMLAMADQDGYVGASVSGIAATARVSVDEARQALDAFLAPDPDSRSDAHEGRRIIVAPRGWTLLNYQFFRARPAVDERRKSNAARMAALRERRKAEAASGQK